MTQNNDLNSWLNLGVDFNPGSPKYGEMVRVIDGKLENLAAQDLAPVDQRIQQFMDEVFGEGAPQVIRETFALDQHGLARTIALPREGNTYSNQIINSFRASFNGAEVMSVVLKPSVSANPFFTFPFKVMEPGTFDFVWVEDGGKEYTKSEKITVG